MTSIPDIEPYELPRPDELPVSTATWPADPARCALLVHDLQRYFVRPLQDRPFYSGLLDHVSRVVSAFRDAERPIFYTGQPGSMTTSERGLLADFWGPGMTARAEDRGFVGDLGPRACDTVLTKWRYSAFHASPLLDRLRRAGCSQLVIVGVYAHVGVLATAIDAMSHDVEPLLVGDAVADFSLAEHTMALTYAARRCARVIGTVELIDELAAHRSGLAA